MFLCSPPAVINSKILTVTVRPEPQPSEPMVVVELSPLINVSLSLKFPAIMAKLFSYAFIETQVHIRSSVCLEYMTLSNEFSLQLLTTA